MTQKNTMQNHKSNLAKLLATENIQVLQNQVKTASFDVKDRVLTIPFFQHNDNNVIDMLIAHEVSHALHTPSKSWVDMKDRSIPILYLIVWHRLGEEGLQKESYN